MMKVGKRRLLDLGDVDIFFLFFISIISLSAKVQCTNSGTPKTRISSLISIDILIIKKNNFFFFFFFEGNICVLFTDLGLFTQIQKKLKRKSREGMLRETSLGNQS